MHETEVPLSILFSLYGDQFPFQRALPAMLLKGSSGSRGDDQPLLWDPVPVFISNPSFLEVGFLVSSQ